MDDDDRCPGWNYIHNFVGPFYLYSQWVNERDGRYQAGEGVYHLFNKVLVLDQEHQVFYGIPGKACGYFEGLAFNALPHQSTMDYLMGCTDPNEHQFSPAQSTKDIPIPSEELECAFWRLVYAFNNQASQHPTWDERGWVLTSWQE